MARVAKPKAGAAWITGDGSGAFTASFATDSAAKGWLDREHWGRWVWCEHRRSGERWHRVRGTWVSKRPRRAANENQPSASETPRGRA
jgi:hypothetical protein